MATTMKARFPLLLLLGIVFLVSISVCYGIAPPKQGNPCHEKCLRNCNRVNNANRRHECETRCEEWAQERCEEEEEEEEEQPRHREPGRREPWRRKESQPREEEEEEERRERPSPPWRPHQKEQGRKERPWGREEGEEEEEEREWRGPGRRGDPEERERTRKREERRWEKERRRRREREEREEGRVSESSGRNNPFFFSSNNFQTPYENENGYIRLVNRFDRRSKIFENLQNYRVLEYKAKPHTLILPHHADADSLLIVRSGRALLTLVYANDRDTFNLDRGDSIRIPPGTTAYLANQDENEDLKVVKLVIPINRPGQFWHFFPATSQNQQSYLFGFSKNTLEAALNTEYEKIDRVLFGEHEQQETPEEGLIVKLSREDIQELGKHAKSSSKKTISSESKPFNLRQRDPIYSNQFGKFYEITPKRSPQLDELDIFLSWVEIKEGGLLLPYFNSRSTIVGVVNEGEGVLELVGLKEEQQEEEQEEEEEEEEERLRNVHRYRAKLSPGDIFVIPASHPFAINASSDLNLLGFGINAEDNERNFLAGENDNVISQIHRAVIDLAFPGSAQDVERLMKSQRHSHFANAQPQQSQNGKQERRSPLSSILGAFY